MKFAPLIFSSLLIAGCGKHPSATVSAEAAAKEDAAGPREADLGRVTLTQDAVARLGIANAAVEWKEARPTRTYSGELSIPTSQQVTISAVVNGYFQLDPDTVPGAQIRAGQRLYRLTPPMFTNNRGGSIDPQRDKAEAEALSARVTKATAEYARQQEMLRQGTGSAAAVEATRAELAATQAAAATAKTTEYWVTLEGGTQYEFASPQSGIVMLVLAVRGQYITMGTPLIRLASLDPLWVRVPVYSGDWSRIARSSAAEVQPVGAAEGETGRMAKPIAGPPTADASSSTRDLYYEAPNPGLRLRPGERVNVRLPLAGAEKRLSTPRGSVVYDVHGGAWVYEAVSATEFVRRRVEVDYTSETAALLTTGPRAGTRVVSAGASELFGVEFGAGK